MKPKKSKLLDIYLQSEIDKVNFPYNPNHWEELKNQLDQYQAQNPNTQSKSSILHKNLNFLIVLIGSIALIYFINSLTEKVQDDKRDLTKEAHPSLDYLAPPKSPSNKNGQDADAELEMIVNPAKHSDNQVNKNKIKNILSLPDSSSHLENLPGHHEDAISKAAISIDSTTIHLNKNELKQDSSNVKKKKKKYLIWD